MFREGERVFMVGAAGEPTCLVDNALSAGVHLITSFVPGINRIDPDVMADKTQVSALFAHPQVMRARPQQFKRLPISYGQFTRLLRDSFPIDTAVVQLSPPDADGRCSLGPMVEFALLAARNANRVIGVLNNRTPRLPGTPTLWASDLNEVVEADTALPNYAVEPDDVARRIANLVLDIIPPRPTIQLGLGKIPNALTQGLSTLRDLTFHSGMLSDGIMQLQNAGALLPGATHSTTALLGSDGFYEWAQEQPEIRIAGCDEIHSARILGGYERLVAINSALEVDLNGQCDLEHAGGRAISGPGGAPDFARSAALSEGGCSIIALPASVKDASRIVPRLSSGVASLGRSDVDVVVTEHGLADLRGLDTPARRKALIAIAAPEHRAALEAAP
ncbi:acetyl-CoA hydrolase/transferase family protein [Aurantiacibacter rhizosphaerae]|uniref:Acetyl-CoA hydrolase/transferase C-terminal domain-containing protein n=1 Tax=Aurantiacibacter rhizosphaerae TaxID=2691582 RepID=A0A844XHW4_9SPHN|nr:acetyl-CoA hydrolase/transferase C-terminal domain-containing protein [Aurantiacibacter rhizosphaerae]MWV29302.1 hypothetical protein [Aurantiacibacter rhizosphaerae]